MSSRIARFAVVGAALALPLSAMIAAPATAAPTTTTRPIVTSAVPKANVRTGPSPWRGAPLRHPNGSAFYPKVLRWANLVSAVMAEQKIPQKYLPGILAQIQQQSSGNPNAINLWDSNARRGTPSMGLLQVIAPTYQAYAKPGYRSLRYQAVPYTNIWAALNYVRHTYGMGKFARWNQGQNWAY